MLDKEFDFYKKNQKDFVEKYNGRYIVLQGKKVLGDYDTQLDAYLESVKDHDLGTFLIQFVSPGKESYTATYHSRVILT